MIIYINKKFNYVFQNYGTKNYDNMKFYPNWESTINAALENSNNAKKNDQSHYKYIERVRKQL